MSLGGSKSPIGEKPVKSPEANQEDDITLVPLWVYIIAGLAILATLFIFLRKKIKVINKKDLAKNKDELERLR